MRVVFVTHNELGLACLQELVQLGANIRAVYTRPESKDIADQTDLQAFANEHAGAFHRVESVNTDAVKEQLMKHKPDLMFVVGWSQLVDSEVLNVPSVAALGMHPAPLPRGRGRAPVAWTLIKGLEETALSFFHLVEEPDAGDLIGQETIPITIEDDTGSLYDKVVQAGRRLIRQFYPEFAAGRVPGTPQNDSNATWWPKREPNHGLIDWRQEPKRVYDWIRGQTQPYPGAFSYLNQQKVTIWGAKPPSDEAAFVVPGEIAYYDEEVLGVGAWEGIVELTEVQVYEQPVPANHLVTQYEYEVGDVFQTARDELQE